MNLSTITHGGRLLDTSSDSFSLILQVDGKAVARVSCKGSPPYAWSSVDDSDVTELRSQISVAVQDALGTAIAEADHWLAACLADGAQDGEEAALWVAQLLQDPGVRASLCLDETPRWSVTSGLTPEKEHRHGGKSLCPVHSPEYEKGGPSGVVLLPAPPPAKGEPARTCMSCGMTQ